MSLCRGTLVKAAGLCVCLLAVLAVAPHVMGLSTESGEQPQAAREIEAAVKAGKMSKEDAEKKLSALLQEMSGDEKKYQKSPK